MFFILAHGEMVFVTGIKVTEDAFHRLQQPQRNSPPSDEDLENVAQIAIWNCNPDLHRRLKASASYGHLTLAGTVATERQRSSIEAAVLGLGNDPTRLTNKIEVTGAAKNEEEKALPSAAHQEVAGEPMLYVRQYCGIEPYSLTAALHEALEVLDRRFLDLGLAMPDEAIVVYRTGCRRAWCSTWDMCSCHPPMRRATMN